MKVGGDVPQDGPEANSYLAMKDLNVKKLNDRVLAIAAPGIDIIEDKDAMEDESFVVVVEGSSLNAHSWSQYNYFGAGAIDLGMSLGALCQLDQSDNYAYVTDQSFYDTEEEEE
jgi:hypothetical protein